MVLTLFAGRLVQIQGMEAGYYRQVAKKQTFEAIPLPAMRGTIYGADGQVLAMTVETYTVTADPPQIADKPHAAQELAGPLGLTEQQVLNLLEHPTSKDYVVLAKGVSAPNQTRIAALNIAGIASSSTYARDYPDGDATANVVGFTNVNPATGVIAGQTGLEQEYNKLLSGTPGSEQVEIGADGQPIPLAGSKDTPAQNGTGIRLTIIPALQLAAQQACQAEVNKTDARQCTVVIIQPKTGAILAMAQWPTYDQNTLTNVADAKNLAVQDIFAPGSTAKVMTAAAAFERGGQTPMSPYYIPSEIYRGGQWITDADGRRRLALHDRGHHRALQQRRHVPGGRARPAAGAVRLPARLRPRRADRAEPAGGEQGDPADAGQVGGRRAVHAVVRPGQWR